MDIETQKALAEQALAALERGNLQTVDIACAKLNGYRASTENTLWHLVRPDGKEVLCMMRSEVWMWEHVYHADCIPHYTTDLNAAASLQNLGAVFDSKCIGSDEYWIVGYRHTYGERVEFRSRSEATARTGAWLKMVAAVGLPERGE